MEFEGGILEGAVYGGLTPADFDGLMAWYRTSDISSSDIITSNYVGVWRDLSGNGRHLDTFFNKVNLITSIYYPRLYNTIHGYGINGTNVQMAMGCSTDTDFKKVLYNGSAVTLIVIYRQVSAYTSTNQNMFSTGSLHYDYSLYRMGMPTATFMANQVTKGVYGSSTTIWSAPLNSSTIPSVDGAAFCLIDTGYDSVNNHRYIYVNNETTPRSSGKFSAAPATLSDSYMIEVTTPPNGYLYEIILYDNTGKTATQILNEKDRLMSEYVKIKYPNIY